MKRLIQKIERRASIAILLSYLIMMGVITFHHHCIDFDLDSATKVKSEKTSDDMGASAFAGCRFIHQASNTAQFFETHNTPATSLSLVTLIRTLRTNSFSFNEIKLSYLRAPPYFS